MMTVQTFIATIRHDSGAIRLKVVSRNGKQGALQQIKTAEGCPKCAIVDIARIDKNTNY